MDTARTLSKMISSSKNCMLRPAGIVDEFRRCLLAVLALAYVFAAAVQGATYFVSNTGANDGAGTETAPLRGIQTAEFDFQLKARSPVIDAGVGFSAKGVEIDFDGDARPSGKGF